MPAAIGWLTSTATARTEPGTKYLARGSVT